ncbi:methyltransferase, FxLD system [Saccharothrix sp. Mg75]|uniref:methyltransferase, FxLD system n=1 Tax=Saccharothrix sp. Mg75 TaxID=3445357 RepID=UPI003EF0468B
MNTASDIDAGAEAAASNPEAFRQAMVDQLRDMGAARSDAVIAALSTVPRHLFGPGEPLDKTYAAKGTLLTKWNDEGEAVSTVSAPHIQAMMLEQADIQPGMRVLEIGSGGYNAALIAELVGPTGEVTTVDIDPEVVTRARECLAAAGYHAVNVVEADAEHGVPRHAPFDRIIVTVAAWDLPRAWWEQLVKDGRTVVPLLLRSLTRSVVFQRVGEHLVSQGYELCAFVPMRGLGAHTELNIPLHGDDVVLRLDDDPGVDVEGLGEVLRQPRTEVWSGVTMGGEGRFDGLHLWMALGLLGFGLLMATRQAQSQDVVAHAWPLGVPAVAAGGSLAYLGLRPVDGDPSAREFGVYGYGSDAGQLIEQMLERIRSWDGQSLSARIGAYPSATPDEQLPQGGLLLDKTHTRVAVTWS